MMDVVRLCAALSVLLAHSFQLIGHGKDEPFRWLTLHGPISGSVDSGGLAVDVFFVLSGYLILRSWDRGRDGAKFISARLKRIVPGYLAAVFVSVFVFGALGTTDLKAYFTAALHANWLGVLGLDLPPNLPTYTGKYAGTLNGSMWTLAIEFRMYLVVLFGGVVGLWDRKYLVPAIAVGSALLFAHDPAFNNPFRFAATFFTGMSAYAFRVKLSPLLGIGTLALWFALIPIGFANVLSPFLFGFGCLCLSSARVTWSLPGDISYGCYLYGWPVLMLLISLGVKEPLNLFAIALPATILCGLLSFVFIEKRFLGRAQMKRAASLARGGEVPELA